ncbi:hypothetical protein OIU85_023943 [Salix viminalis]|uniref:Uncharacterized protein n=1 Tax=Salix viminalis TaxID=40686 RepID=A0A9Q0TZQ9_SALVM|nr:hypothetical protein OIU85_023943 [Salix viminalis]
MLHQFKTVSFNFDAYFDSNRFNLLPSMYEEANRTSLQTLQNSQASHLITLLWGRHCQLPSSSNPFREILRAAGRTEEVRPVEIS